MYGNGHFMTTLSEIKRIMKEFGYVSTEILKSGMRIVISKKTANDDRFSGGALPLPYEMGENDVSIHRQ